MPHVSGEKATQTTVARALAAWQEQYSYLQRTWGTVTATEYFDPAFVAAKNRMRTLAAIYRVEMEAFQAGM